MMNSLIRTIFLLPSFLLCVIFTSQGIAQTTSDTPLIFYEHLAQNQPRAPYASISCSERGIAYFQCSSFSWVEGKKPASTYGKNMVTTPKWMKDHVLQLVDALEKDPQIIFSSSGIRPEEVLFLKEASILLKCFSDPNDVYQYTICSGDNESIPNVIVAFFTPICDSPSCKYLLPMVLRRVKQN